MSDWTSEWLSTPICTLDYSGPQCSHENSTDLQDDFVEFVVEAPDEAGGDKGAHLEQDGEKDEESGRAE